MAARKRCLRTTPSRSGSTRGGSAGSMATRANSGPGQNLQPAGEVCKARLVAHVQARGDPAGARSTPTRSTPPWVWLGCMPVSP